MHKSRDRWPTSDSCWCITTHPPTFEPNPWPNRPNCNLPEHAAGRNFFKRVTGRPASTQMPRCARAPPHAFSTHTCELHLMPSSFWPLLLAPVLTSALRVCASGAGDDRQCRRDQRCGATLVDTWEQVTPSYARCHAHLHSSALTKRCERSLTVTLFDRRSAYSCACTIISQQSERVCAHQ